MLRTAALLLSLAFACGGVKLELQPTRIVVNQEDRGWMRQDLQCDTHNECDPVIYAPGAAYEDRVECFTGCTRTKDGQKFSDTCGCPKSQLDLSAVKEGSCYKTSLRIMDFDLFRKGNEMADGPGNVQICDSDKKGPAKGAPGFAEYEITIKCTEKGMSCNDLKLYANVKVKASLLDLLAAIL